jgi:hypothetical protein
VEGCDAGGANAARTTADNKQIDVELSHINPARSRFRFLFLLDAFSSREPEVHFA